MTKWIVCTIVQGVLNEIALFSYLAAFQVVQARLEHQPVSIWCGYECDPHKMRERRARRRAQLSA